MIWIYEHTLSGRFCFWSRESEVIFFSFIRLRIECSVVLQILTCSLFVLFPEFMSGGSVYDYLHKQKGVFKLPMLLKVAIDVAKGMHYLHQNNIIHRDLKAANLLMDENEVSFFFP